MILVQDYLTKLVHFGINCIQHGIYCADFIANDDLIRKVVVIVVISLQIMIIFTQISHNFHQSIFLFISDNHVVTVPADSTIKINCTNDLRVNIDNITVKQAVTKCQKREQCSVTDDESNAIKLNCTDKVSCEVKNANHGCIQDYGYYNLTYGCQGKFLVCLHFQRRTNAKSVVSFCIFKPKRT